MRRSKIFDLNQNCPNEHQLAKTGVIFREFTSHLIPRRQEMKLHVNGQVREFEAEEDTPLLWVLREQLDLTGTKYGCGIAQCGACTVHIDGEATRSCVRPASTVDANAKIVTIEGLSKDGSHPVQKAWAALD